MAHMGNSVNYRIPHVNIRGCHINLCPQDLLSVFIESVLHVFEQLQVLLHASAAVWALLAGVIKIASVLADLISR